MPAQKSLEYHLTKLARAHIFTVLERVFKIPRKKVKIRLTWKKPVGGRWKDEEGMVIPLGGGRFIVGLNPRCIRSDAHLKGTCAHEAIHIAYSFYLEHGGLAKFWEALEEYIPSAIETLEKYYAGTEEFLVSILEPLVALILVPPAEPKSWSVIITEPQDPRPNS